MISRFAVGTNLLISNGLEDLNAVVSNDVDVDWYFKVCLWARDHIHKAPKGILQIKGKVRLLFIAFKTNVKTKVKFHLKVHWNTYKSMPKFLNHVAYFLYKRLKRKSTFLNFFFPSELYEYGPGALKRDQNENSGTSLLVH